MMIVDLRKDAPSFYNQQAVFGNHHSGLRKISSSWFGVFRGFGILRGLKIGTKKRLSFNGRLELFSDQNERHSKVGTESQPTSAATRLHL
jgi:hypothetical protein